MIIPSPIKFTARLFVTLTYKGKSLDRDMDKTLEGYIESMRKEGIEITSHSFLTLGPSGRHDGYASGAYFNIGGTAHYSSTAGYELNKSGWRFRIFSGARVDYFNAYPILHNSIKLIV